MKIMIASIACAMSLASLAAQGDSQTTPLATDSGSSVEMYATATLAPLGSFEFEVAPIETATLMFRHATAAKLRKGEVTVAQAESALDATDKVRSLIDASKAACSQNDKTGRCTHGYVKARHLLAQAKEILAEAVK